MPGQGLHGSVALPCRAGSCSGPMHREYHGRKAREMRAGEAANKNGHGPREEVWPKGRVALSCAESRIVGVTTSLFDLYKIGVGPSSSHTIHPTESVMSARRMSGSTLNSRTRCARTGVRTSDSGNVSLTRTRISSLITPNASRDSC